jgi:hypothetical protein
VTGVAQAVSGINIEGPTAPTETTSEPEESGITVRINGGPEVPLGALENTIAPGKNVELFDKSAYLDAPMIDGQAADHIVVAFSGSIKWDATDAQGRMMFEKLVLGKDVDLRISGVVAKKHGSWKLAGKEGEEQEVVTGQCSVKVTDLFVLAPEDLG